MKLTSKIVAASLAIILAGAVAAAAETGFPSKPIRIIAPVPPGSPPDAIGRLIADQLARELGQPVIVDNRPGANQTIGLALVARAAADGHTLGMVSLPTAVVPNIVASMPFDTLRDLAPVRELAWTSNVLVVSSTSDIDSVETLIARAMARPASLTYASGGNGTPAHVIAELFRDRSKTSIVHVPFKGAAEGVAAVIGGHVDLMFGSASAVETHIRARKLRALAQTSSGRLSSLEDVPTLAECGFPDIVVRDWQGIVAPAGTPSAVIERLSTAIARVLARQEIRDRLLAMSFHPVDDSDPQAFVRLMQSELRRWQMVAKSAGLRAE